ncbi:MAG: hypothetical protein ABSF24_06525 [Candidatus Bathyarchaeia archaeon]
MRDKQQGKIRSIDRTIFEWSRNRLIVEVAKEPEEVRTLLEARFGYMCQKEIRGFLRNANELEHQKVYGAFQNVAGVR